MDVNQLLGSLVYSILCDINLFGVAYCIKHVKVKSQHWLLVARTAWGSI